MRDSDSYDAVGVDGGGTSCRIAVMLGGRRASLKTGAANVSSDFDGALTTICEGVAALAAELGATPERLFALPAYLGLAGVVDAEMGARVTAALPFAQAKVEDDRISTLVGALCDHDGAVAGIGTGSFLARQAGGRYHLIGGYGLRLGDEASAAWLGRGLLSRALHASDGLSPATPLTDAILEEFGGAGGIVPFATRATPGDFGRYAPRVVEEAAQDDAVARALMESGAEYIIAGLAAIGWTPTEPLCLTGGVGPTYAPYLPEKTAKAVVAPKSNGLDGALHLAQRLATTPVEGAP